MASATRSFGIQCDSKRSTGVQTKRLSKDEIRYFAKIIEKEREVLLKFMDATEGTNATQLYHVDIVPGHKPVKVLKKYGPRKKPKRRNKRKHSVKAAAHQAVEEVENVEGKAHYVSKIVVDDNAQSLKLSLKSCRPRISSSGNEFKENEHTMERARSRKAKRPRRVCRVKEEELSFSEARVGTVSPAPRPSSPNIAQAPTFNATFDCRLASKNTRIATTCTNSGDGNENHTVVQKMPETKTINSLLTSMNKDDTPTDKFVTSTSSEEETTNFVSVSDDEQSDCSEEFSIVEPSEVTERKQNTESIISTQSTQATTSASDDTVIKDTTKMSHESMKSELKKRVKANLIRRQIDNNTGSGSKANEGDALPQVVSVHFYDPQNQCQRVIDPNTHITQYAASDGTHVMLNNPASPQTSLTPPLRSAVVTSPDSFQPLQNTSSQSPTGSLLAQGYPQASSTNVSPSQFSLPQTSSISVSPTQLSLPQYHQHPNGKHNQSPTVTYSNSVNKVRAGYHSSYSTQSVPTNISRSREVGNIPPVMFTDSIPVSASGSGNSTIDAMSRDREPANNEAPKPAENNQAEPNPRGMKRKRFIFGSDEAPRKKVISSLLTPLCEREAIRLADGIHDINMQFFPLRSLAQKAASRASEDTDDVLKLIDQKIQLKTKVQDVEKARNLLKDIYDMVLKSKEIEDIQNFELVSHNFGVRNILNHLSLVDLYFGELGSELQSKI